jgi:hypothetical protein
VSEEELEQTEAEQADPEVEAEEADGSEGETLVDPGAPTGAEEVDPDEED